MKLRAFIFMFALARTQIAVPAEVTIEDLKHQNMKVDEKSYDYVPASQRPISSSARDHFFETVDLYSYLQKYDEAEKNLLYMRLKKLSLLELKHYYPSFSSVS